MVDVKFIRSSDGSVLTEGLIVIPIVMLAIAVIIEFGYMMAEWNMGAKAMQLAARKLIVSDPLTTDFDTAFASTPSLGGQSIPPDATTTSTCSGDGAGSCDQAKFAEFFNGNGTGSTWQGLRNYFPALEPGDVTVTYERNGLGYHGRPCGAVVTVRVELNHQPRDLLVTRLLLQNAVIPFYRFTASATSEDLSSDPKSC